MAKDSARRKRVTLYRHPQGRSVRDQSGFGIMGLGSLSTTTVREIAFPTGFTRTGIINKLLVAG